jgi:hypothetical protein
MLSIHYKTLSCDYIKYYFVLALFTIILTNGHVLISFFYSCLDEYLINACMTIY